jgi:alkylation response protein AidB-like acyl-CoA dehydrogenase
MDLNFSKEDQDFQSEVREFLDNEYPKHIKAKVDNGDDLTRDEIVEWHKVVAKKGWMGHSWPVEYGGTGWDATKRYIYLRELALEGCPMFVPFGLQMVAPVIYTFGSQEQKDKFLPRILNFDDWWCQGYSEPGSGSDLASLKTKAVRDGDHYIINGQKTWTTLGQHADWIFVLVRTSDTGKKQEGITFILVDMKTPGVEVKPIITIDGDHEVNEVWFDNVRVPAENVVGEEGQGWTYAKFLLFHERSSIAGAPQMRRAVNSLTKRANKIFHDEKPLAEDPLFKSKVAQFHLDLDALEMTELRGLAAEREGKGPGPESSLLKIKGTELQQRLTTLALEATGHEALPYGGPYGFENQEVMAPKAAQSVASKYLNFRKVTIYGGTNEIQKNIIAKAVLGL